MSMQNTDSLKQPHPIAGALYRTRICKFGDTCQYGDRCFYAHSDSQIRPRNGTSPSILTCKISDPEKRPSRRSSAVLSDINYDLTGMSAESCKAMSRRSSYFIENAENMGNYSPSNAQICVIGTLLPPMPDISAASCDSVDTSSFCGSLSPISPSAKENVGEGQYAYCYAWVRYLLSVYQPAALAQLLKDAAPKFYMD